MDWLNMALTWLANFFPALLEKLFNVLIDLVQGAIDMIPLFITSIIQLIGTVCPPIPASLTAVGSATGQNMLTVVLNALAWMFPLHFLSLTVHMIICAISSYIVWMIIMRWVKIST